MASCVSCRKRTTSFCFVHRCSICDDCLVSPAVANTTKCECNCVIRNYFDWLADSEYEWPPKCPLCNRSVTNDPALSIRLVCKCLYHRSCLSQNISKQSTPLQCPTCHSVLFDVNLQAKSKLREQIANFITETKAAAAATAPTATATSVSTAAPPPSTSTAAVSATPITADLSATSSSPSNSKLNGAEAHSLPPSSSTSSSSPSMSQLAPSAGFARQRSVDIESQTPILAASGRVYDDGDDADDKDRSSKQRRRAARSGQSGGCCRCTLSRIIALIMAAALIASVIAYVVATQRLSVTAPES